jgi:hypothetical protein
MEASWRSRFGELRKPWGAELPSVPSGARLMARCWRTGAGAHAPIDLLTRGSTSTIIQRTLKAPGFDESSGRCVCSVSRFDVATGLMGEARGTTMANVKAAI